MPLGYWFDKILKLFGYSNCGEKINLKVHQIIAIFIKSISLIYSIFNLEFVNQNTKQKVIHEVVLFEKKFDDKYAKP